MILLQSGFSLKFIPAMFTVLQFSDARRIEDRQSNGDKLTSGTQVCRILSPEGMHLCESVYLSCSCSRAASILEAQTPENPSVDTHGSVNLPSCGSGSGNNRIRLPHLLPPSPRRLCVFPSSSSYTFFLPFPSPPRFPFFPPPASLKSTIHPFDYSISSTLLEWQYRMQTDTGFKVHEWSMRKCWRDSNNEILFDDRVFSLLKR